MPRSVSRSRWRSLRWRRASPEAAPERSVVTEDGMLVGFVDRRAEVGAPPQPVVRGARRGPRAMPDVADAEQQRSLEAEFPDTVAAGSVEWLLVHIAAGAAR